MSRKNRSKMRRGVVARVGDTHGGGRVGGGYRLLPNLGLWPGDDPGPVDPARLLADLERLGEVGRRASST
jgi:hypothetical protein